MLILITGGSKSGKSRIGEALIASYPLPRYYIATMEPYGREAAEVILRHRKMRAGKGFSTIEKYTDIQDIRLEDGAAVLLECAGNLCANEMFSKGEADPAGKILEGTEVLCRQARVLVIVTSQVGDDGIGYPPETMEYIKNMGMLNRMLAERADMVIEAVCGIPLMLKGEKPPCLC